MGTRAAGTQTAGLVYGVSNTYPGTNVLAALNEHGMVQLGQK